MRKTGIILIFILIIHSGTAQIMGLSASKLAAINAETAMSNQIEFEPSFGYFWAQQHYNAQGKTEPIGAQGDSTSVFRDMAFRVTYGIGNRLEAGMLITSDLNNLSFGLKYHFFTRGKWAAAFIAGTTLANESDLVALNSGIYGKTYSLAAGLALTWSNNERFTVDADVQYQCLRDDEVSYSNDIYGDIEAGYRFNSGRQLIAGFSFIHNRHTHAYDGHQNYLLTMNLGAILASGEHYELVGYSPIPLAGKNFDRVMGINMALTLLIP